MLHFGKIPKKTVKFGEKFSKIWQNVGQICEILKKTLRKNFLTKILRLESGFLPFRVEEGYFAHVSCSSRLAPPSDPVRLNQTLDSLAVLWSQAIHLLLVCSLRNVPFRLDTAFLDSLCSDESLFAVPNSFPGSPFLP